jgi:hypothetical protein
MSRYINTISTNRKPEKLQRDIVAYLEESGFQLVDAELNVWQKGMGLLTGPQFVQFEVRDGELHLEAWIKFALLPGVYLGEMGTDGFFAFIPKSQLKSRVQDIEHLAT